MRKDLVLVLTLFGLMTEAYAWAAGGGPEIPAGAGPFVLAGVVGVVFLTRYFTRKK